MKTSRDASSGHQDFSEWGQYEVEMSHMIQEMDMATIVSQLGNCIYSL